MYETKSKDIYQDFSEVKEIFDFSNYSESQNFLKCYTLEQL